MQVKIQLARQAKVPMNCSGSDMRLIYDGTN
jgi:hypothetical protein